MAEDAKTKVPQRCAWAGTDALMQAYHDDEWGVPERDPRALWECLMLEGFQAGLSWITVLRKREAFRQAFHQFDPRRVAGMTEKDVLRLLDDPGIIRSRAKIEATIQGAKIFNEMADRGEDFSAFCWSFTDGRVLRGNGGAVPASTALSETISKELKRRGFKFVGPTIVYAWMQAVGIVDDHTAGCFRHGRRARLHNESLHGSAPPGAMTTMDFDSPRRLRVGQPITPEQFEELSDEQLERLVPKAYREYFPGKDFCADGYFYLHDGTAWSFYRGGFLDE